MKKDGLKRWIKQPETAGKRPNPWVIWVLVGAIAILALSGLFDGLTGQNAPSEPKPAAPADDMTAFKAKLEKLTMMQEAGLLSAEEFASMKAELLKSIL